MEASDEVFQGEIFKGPLAGFGLQVMNIGAVSAMLHIPKEHISSDHKLTGLVANGGVVMPLNTEIAQVVWNKANSGQSSAT